jgi:hypothetical protein
MKHRLILFILSTFGIVGWLQAQDAPLLPMKPRVHFGAKLEPEGILVGAGQANKNSFDEFTKAVGPGLEPVIYMDYLGLKKENLASRFQEKAAAWNASNMLTIPQIGLSMTTDGKPELHYEQDVIAGKHDQAIESLVAELERYNRPVYLRLGYEFNGHWNGYESENFKLAWIKVAKAIRARFLNVALVWCFAPDGTNKNFMPFYPGDEWVDWWAVDLFSEKHFADSSTKAFMDSALVHRKPVMIGESTPRRVSVDLGQESWNRWFVPYFNFMRQHPHVKGFSYINWNWAGTNWPDWGNGRLQDNELVRKKFIKEISRPEYLKGLKK